MIHYTAYQHQLLTSGSTLTKEVTLDAGFCLDKARLGRSSTSNEKQALDLAIKEIENIAIKLRISTTKDAGKDMRVTSHQLSVALIELARAFNSGDKKGRVITAPDFTWSINWLDDVPMWLSDALVWLDKVIVAMRAGREHMASKADINLAVTFCAAWHEQMSNVNDAKFAAQEEAWWQATDPEDLVKRWP